MQNTENKFKHDGVWYFSDDRKDDLAVCNGCACYENRQACKSAPACYAGGRQDNRNVIFVRSDVDNLGDEK